MIISFCNLCSNFHLVTDIDKRVARSVPVHQRDVQNIRILDCQNIRMVCQILMPVKVLNRWPFTQNSAR